MIKHWTESALKDELKKLTIICDSKEKVFDHIESYFKKHSIPYKVRQIETGDYSAMIGDMTFENDVVIERKANLDEICGNFTLERERFEREFIRAKAHGIKMFLIVESATWSDIFIGNYRSQLSSKSLTASILSWLARFNVTLIFCRPEETARIIYGICYYFAREKLMYG